MHRAYNQFIINPSSLYAGKCLKFNVYRTTLALSLCHCPKISNFWEQVLGYINLVTSITVHDPLMLLFSCHQAEAVSTINSQTSNLQWIHIYLLTAWRAIMRHWITNVSPMVAELITNMNKTAAY